MLLGLLLAAQSWLSYSIRGEPIAWSRSLAVWLTWALLWTALTPIALGLAARFPLDRPLRLSRILLHVCAGALLASVNLALFAVVAPWVGAMNLEPTWWTTFSRLMATAFLLNMPMYWLLVGSLKALRIAQAVRQREHATLRLEAQLAEARLETLRAQLRPHFLFNALNTVAVLMREDVSVAERVLLRLSDLLRATLEKDEAHQVALRDEVALLEAYLTIEQMRYGDRLSYHIQIAPDALTAQVPRMVLQTLVENAVEHGIAKRRAPGRIEIAAECQGDRLSLSVADDGPGLDPDVSEGIGLSNTRSRLALLYGGQHRFELNPAPGGGLLVSMQIPLRESSAQ